MGRFIIVSFGVLAWVFWELSGGADFVPEQRVAAAPAPEPAPRTAEAGGDEIVARTDGLQLARVAPEPPAGLVQQASLTQTQSLQTQRTEAIPTDVTARIEAVPEAQPEAVTESVPGPVLDSLAPPADIREVAGSWVNLRSGPGTGNAKITALPGGTEVEVLEVDASGWARLRVVDGDLTGWMAERLLTDGGT